MREETGEEREAPRPPPAAEESSSYYSSEEEVPETVSQKVAAPPPVPSQETKPKQRPSDTPSSSSEEEEEEDQVGPIQTAQQMSVVRKSSPEEVSPTVRAQSAPRATSRQIKRPSQNKVSLNPKWVSQLLSLDILLRGKIFLISFHCVIPAMSSVDF